MSVVFHDGFHDYRAKVLEMAPDFDAVILGAAVANLIPVRYIKDVRRDPVIPVAVYNDPDRKSCDVERASWRESVELPLKEKFPSHDYKPGDRILMEWTIAPRVIDEVKSVMKPGAHLFGFKLLSGVLHDELITAAYGVLLESKATMVFANDANDLQTVYGVAKDRSEQDLDRSHIAETILQLCADQYYKTVVDGDWDAAAHRMAEGMMDEAVAELDMDELFPETPEGMVFGTVAVRAEGAVAFVTTARGKREMEDIVMVRHVDHDDKREIHTVGGKATLNAPLLDFLFRGAPKCVRIVHHHRQVDGLLTESWAPPGTVRDSLRMEWLNPPRMRGQWSFNVEGHGCYLLYDKEGNLL